jgi:hypothetical protein
VTGACIGSFAVAATHARQKSTACASVALFVLSGITAAYGNISASFRSGPDPAVHAMAVWNGESSPDDNYEKKIQSLGTTLTDTTNAVLAYDGPHLSCQSRASVEIDVAPRPPDLNTLSFDVQASVDTSMIDASNGVGFSRVDFQIVVTLQRDAQISAAPGWNSSTNRGGIRLLYGSYLNGPYSLTWPGSPVPLPEHGDAILRAGEYIIDVYLFADTFDLTPRRQNASASFNFSTMSIDTPLPAIPGPPSSPIGLGSDTYIYYDSLPEDSPYLEYIPYEFRGLVALSKGHPWYSSYLYNNHYYYVEGFSFLGYRFTQGLVNTNWLSPSADPRIFYSAPSTDTQNPSASFTYGGLQVSTPNGGFYQPDGSFGENAPFGLDANGGSANISASYSVGGNQTWGSAYGFMVRIDVDDQGAVVSYAEPPTGLHYTISNFEMGQPLTSGSYFFGIVADPNSMPPYVPPNYPPGTYPYFNGGDGAVSINVSRPPRPAPTPPPKVTNAFRSSGKFTLQWADEFNRAVHVQRSTNLSSTNWQTVRSNVSTKTFTDTNTPTGSAFYRLLIP